LDDRQQLAVLRKLYCQKRFGELKRLLRLQKLKLGGEFGKLLLEVAILRDDEELAYKSMQNAVIADSTLGLILAVKHARTEMIDYFLAYGAETYVDMSVLPYERKTSLQIACERGDIGLIHLLLEYDEPKRTWLHVAAYYECFDLIQNMSKCKQFENVKNTLDKYGRSPLFFAVVSANFPLVKFLASTGCSLKFVDEEGCNLLHIAATRRMTPIQREDSYKEMIPWLIEQGCDISAHNSHGETPFEYGAKLEAPLWALSLLVRYPNPP
jgi:ankyrin repeat protein